MKIIINYPALGYLLQNVIQISLLATSMYFISQGETQKAIYFIILYACIILSDIHRELMDVVDGMYEEEETEEEAKSNLET